MGGDPYIYAHLRDQEGPSSDIYKRIYFLVVEKYISYQSTEISKAVTV